MHIRLIQILIFSFALLNLAAQNDESKLPSSNSEKFSPAQDSAYYGALRLKLPIEVQLRTFLLFSDKDWEAYVKAQQSTSYSKLAQNLKDIPEALLKPTGQEKTAYQENINKAFYVPFVNTLPQYGVKIPFSAIGSLLGLIEDVSPEITYTIDFNADVEVVVYSLQANVINTLFKGPQKAGSYKLFWNGRDTRGKLMPPGDYIAEVRISDTKYIRKRIVVNQ